MSERIEYISDISYYLGNFERLGARYDLVNTSTEERLFTTLLRRCIWPPETRFIHPAWSPNACYADVWGIQFGALRLPQGISPKIPGQLTVCGIADGGNHYLVLDDQGYFYTVDHEDGSVYNLEEDAVMMDNLLIESGIIRTLIGIGYPKKAFGDEHLPAVEQLKPVEVHDVVAHGLALAQFHFSKGEIAVAMKQFIRLFSTFSYFPNLSGHERSLMQRLLSSEQLIQAEDAGQFKELLVLQLQNGRGLDPLLAGIFLHYILAVK